MYGRIPLRMRALRRAAPASSPSFSSAPSLPRPLQLLLVLLVVIVGGAFLWRRRGCSCPHCCTKMATFAGTAAAAPALARRQFSVLTWNIWFGDQEREARTAEQLRIVKDLQPTLVALQEATPWSKAAYMADAELMQLYHVSPQDVHPYGVLILVRKDGIGRPAQAEPRAAAGKQNKGWRSWLGLGSEAGQGTRQGEVDEDRVRFRSHRLPTRMARNLLTADLPVGSGDGAPFVRLGTVHLESLNNHGVRMQQLERCHETLAQAGGDADDGSGDCEGTLLVGDFNFCSDQNFGGGPPTENGALERLLPDYVDLWSLLHDATEPGHTFDSETNSVLTRFEQMRYDRIMFSFRHSSTSPAAASLDDDGSANDGVNGDASAQEPLETPPRAGSGAGGGNVAEEDRARAAAGFAAMQPSSWTPVSVRMVGTDPIPRPPGSTAPPCHPSDHYGLFATFEAAADRDPDPDPDL